MIDREIGIDKYKYISNQNIFPKYWLIKINCSQDFCRGRKGPAEGFGLKIFTLFIGARVATVMVKSLILFKPVEKPSCLEFSSSLIQIQHT